MLRALALILALTGALLPQAGQAQNVPPELVAEMPQEVSSRLAHILQRGTLIVGVKDDYPPWGMRNEAGALIGLEPDLARELADRMGVELELQAVNSANRMARVNQGVVDVVIATTGDTAERRRQVGMLQPNYYSSGVVVLTREGYDFNSWEELRGRKLCLKRGAYYNRTLEEDYGIDGEYFSSNRDSRLALQQGRCVGWAFDDTALVQLINSQNDAAAGAGQGASGTFRIMDETILVSPWAILVAKGEEDAPLGRFVSDMIGEWHAAGRILDLQDKWGIPRSDFVVAKHALWRAVQFGRAVCARDPETGDHLYKCLNEAPLQSAPDPDPPGWIVTLYEVTGIDLRAAASPYNLERLQRGLMLTLALSLFAIIGALLVGVTLSMMHIVLAGFGLIGRILLLPQKLLVTVARMTPPILQLYIVFFGLGGILGNSGGFLPGSFAIAVVILSLYAGATNSIILSHALEAERAIHPDKSALALLPGAVSRGFDGLVAACVNIVKGAGMASAIAVGELISTINLLVSEGADTTTLMNGLLLFYFLFILGLVWLFKALRRRMVRS
ncbi:transporter substrate-binding domain-containing protein [uncultured Roseobacter sp.]|uniref:transporter substrate-binding domain-containing protein n=1 Tax=uncultured Roseobacter sp. TaxID=114847 RepID=UPI00260B6592|nr:transporter substrate-binding domain-containing protein [uncultured Roseobacter sp.]